MRSQIATLEIQCYRRFQRLRSQIVTSNGLMDCKKICKLEKKYNNNFKEIFKALNLLLIEKQQLEDFSKRERIGFKKEKVGQT